MKTILIIDGQGGMLGKQMVEAVKRLQADGEIIAVGTNSIATANMLKAGADRGATGENAVIVAARSADIIVGSDRYCHCRFSAWRNYAENGSCSWTERCSKDFDTCE